MPTIVTVAPGLPEEAGRWCLWYDGAIAAERGWANILRCARARALTTEDEITFIVEYDCVRCGARLEAKSSQADGWLRCPQCGRAGLPPPYMKLPRPRARAPLGDDVLVIGPLPPGALRPGRSGFGRGSVRRISGALTLFFLLLTAYFVLLDKFSLGAWIFGLITLACVVLAALPVHRA